jgi:hypothetical protein
MGQVCCGFETATTPIAHIGGEHKKQPTAFAVDLRLRPGSLLTVADQRVSDVVADLYMELEASGRHAAFANGAIVSIMISYLECLANCLHRGCEMAALITRSVAPIDINAHGLRVLGQRANSIPTYLSETHTHEVARLRLQVRRKNLVRSSWTALLSGPGIFANFGS